MQPPRVSSKPAPGKLAIVQSYINSYDLESGEDDFSDPADMQEWFRHFGLPAGDHTPSRKQHRVGIELREALRELLRAASDGGSNAKALASLDRIAAMSPLITHFGEGGSGELVPVHSDLLGGIGMLLAFVHEAQLRGDWTRLKVCRNDACQWAFYDQSKNGRGTWCSMDICGNRMKARTYRRRHANS